MIYLDISAAVHSKAGQGRYSQSLAEALDALQPGRFGVFFNQGTDGRLPPSLAHLPQSRVRLGYKPWRMSVLLGNLSHISFRRLTPGAELFHATEHLLMPLPGLPTVLTVHDLIYKLFPQHHKRLNYWYLNLAMPIYCRRASKVITISEASKRDIVTHYGLEPGKIEVVYEAAAPHFRPPPPQQIEAVRRRLGLPEQYLLHLGTIEPRKNLSRLVDALTIVRRTHPDMKLLLAGARGWLYHDFFHKIEAEGLSDVVLSPGWVEDEELPAMIAAARLAVQPSLYEGFGLPLLEHMACGQVVASSNRSSLPEVGGDAAAYFDPENVEEMAAVILRLLADDDEREDRRQLGLEQAARFSWERAARETIAIYDGLLAA